jgi:hypothetical protein
MGRVEDAKCRAYTVCRNDLSAEREREDNKLGKASPTSQKRLVGGRRAQAKMCQLTGCAYGVIIRPLRQARLQNFSCYLRRSE